IRVVFVHGGGPQSTDLQKALGIEPRMVEGRRVTCAKTLEVSAMVLNGLVNTRILAICRELKLPAIGLSGVDGGLIKARKRPIEPVDFGFVGDVIEVDAKLLEDQLKLGYVPVVSPLSADNSGTLLNINADTVASAIAVAMKAEKLILATGAAGILEDPKNPQSLVSYTDLAGLESLKRMGRLEVGMIPKASSIASALNGGVPRVHVISYEDHDALLLEVFTNEGTGTLIVKGIDSLTPEEQKAGESQLAASSAAPTYPARTREREPV
ncbi:MAG TPA: acetylglutamate kinase, partial [Vicinamibacteria bacterium]|nr:acetylglutamate kinase [Vicinamibacteria bacterium]